MNKYKMIFGAPGCGKTTYLINLLEGLLKKYQPNEIAFVSFTKKGSYEGRDRAMEIFNLKEEDFPYFHTIHSLAFRNLKASRYDMISRRNYKEFSTAMGMNFIGYYTEDLSNNDDKYLFACSLKLNNPASFERNILHLDYNKFRMVEKNYSRYKEEIGIIDFDDLIVNFLKKGQALPVKVAIIDEAQDLTSLQWQFCEMAFKNCENIYIAGDDDQAIYEWSGADIPKFLQYTKSSDITILDKSYRLRENILNFSKLITNHITTRVPKKFDPVDTGGNIYFYNQLDDISINSEQSYYFLSRNNYFLRYYKEFLVKKGIVFRYKKDPSVVPAHYNAILKYEQYRKHDPSKIKTDNSLAHLLKKNVEDGAVWYEALNIDLDECNYYRDIFKNKTDVTKCNSMVNTIHGVKGGEADNVVFLMNLTKSVYGNLHGTEEELSSELRCLYVAMTRAKKNLHIVYSSSKIGYDEIFKGGTIYGGH